MGGVFEIRFRNSALISCVGTANLIPINRQPELGITRHEITNNSLSTIVLATCASSGA